MASLAANFTAFLFVFPAGLRRLLLSSSLYLKNPSVFRSRPWYFSDQRHKNIDLYFLIISLPIASFSELFFFLTFSGHPTFRFSFFMQSASLFLFWVLIIIIVFRETYDAFIVSESFAFLFLGISFLVEYSVVGKGIEGPLGGEAYSLLGELTLVCAGACLVLSIKPTSFFAEFFLSCGLIFKGTWLLQTGFSLYTDTFAFKGCHKIFLSATKDFIDSQCDFEDGRRGVAFINLLFVAHAIAVFIGSVVLFGLLSSHKNLGHGEASGPLLAQLESDNLLMRPVPEFELE